jgi:hypothetical protein
MGHLTDARPIAGSLVCRASGGWTDALLRGRRNRLHPLPPDAITSIEGRRLRILPWRPSIRSSALVAVPQRGRDNSQQPGPLQYEERACGFRGVAFTSSTLTRRNRGPAHKGCSPLEVSASAKRHISLAKEKVEVSAL